jgi:hypothetical protein
MPATEAAPPVLAPAAVTVLEALRTHLELRGERLDEAAARHLGRSIAAALAEGHATLDDEGNLAPVIHGRLGARHVGIDPGGVVTILPASAGDAVTAPELLQGGRLTPRADVHALGTMLAPLFAGSADGDLRAALATASEPLPAQRRITCVEIEAWLARGTDLEAGRLALGEAVRAYLDASLPIAAIPPSSRPLTAPARVGVALFTAAAVFAAGVAVAEGWLGRFR